MSVYNVPLILFITSASQRALLIAAHHFFVSTGETMTTLYQDWHLLDDGNFYIHS